MKEYLVFLSTILFVIFVLCFSVESSTLEKLDQQLFDAIYDEKNFGSTRYSLMESFTYFGDPYAVIGLSLISVTYGKEKNQKAEFRKVFGC